MRSFNYLLVVWLMFFFLCVVSESDEDWTSCPKVCNCGLYSGKKKANCALKNLTAIPDSLNTDIQSLDISNNTFPALTANTFQQVGLVNLEIIKLRACQIKELDKDAFKGLQSLVELDLSVNNIHTIHPDTFIENVRLRFLYVRENPIQALGNGLFRNLLFLKLVDFSDCTISSIDLKTFDQVPNLRSLKLYGNQLTHIQLSSVESLTKLRQLGLEDNPWRCDCHLREFRDWVISRGLYTRPTVCVGPSRLRNKFWDSIDPEKFACKPKILYPPPGTIIKTSGENDD